MPPCATLGENPSGGRRNGPRRLASIGGMRHRLKRWLPSEQALRERRSLRWLGPLLRRPWLWHLSRRSVAAGAAIGVFFGLLIPVLQIGFAALVAVLLRANLPVAAASTLVSNPATYVPIVVAAYRTGSALLGERVDDGKIAALLGDEEASEPPAGWLQRGQEIGKPLIVGLALFATVGALVTWSAVNLAWTLAVRLRRRGGRQARAPTRS